MKSTGKSKVFGIIGWPVSHSLSPVFQNAAFEYLGLDCCYVPFPVEAGKIDASMSEAGEPVDGRSILILGAGGASRAVVFSLAEGGASTIIIANRTVSKAESLTKQVQQRFPAVNIKAAGMEHADLKSVFHNVDMIINTTSIGLKREDPSPAPKEFLHKDLFVCNLIYNPPDTELIRYAKELCRGHMNGSGMLIHQGAASFKLWTGIEPPIQVMRQALQDALQHRSTSSR